MFSSLSLTLVGLSCEFALSVCAVLGWPTAPDFCSPPRCGSSWTFARVSRKPTQTSNTGKLQSTCLRSSTHWCAIALQKGCSSFYSHLPEAGGQRPGHAGWCRTMQKGHSTPTSLCGVSQGFPGPALHLDLLLCPLLLPSSCHRCCPQGALLNKYSAMLNCFLENPTSDSMLIFNQIVKHKKFKTIRLCLIIGMFDLSKWIPHTNEKAT